MKPDELPLSPRGWLFKSSRECIRGYHHFVDAGGLCAPIPPMKITEPNPCLRPQTHNPRREVNVVEPLVDYYRTPLHSLESKFLPSRNVSSLYKLCLDCRGNKIRFLSTYCERITLSIIVEIFIPWSFIFKYRKLYLVCIFVFFNN